MKPSVAGLTMRVGCLAALLVHAVPRAHAQVPAQDPGTFSSRVNLVSVPVVVRGQDGRPVGKLQQDDFQIQDKGKAQVITKFTIEKSVVPVKPPAAPAPAAASSAPTSEPDPRNPALPSRFVAYYFDDLHVNADDFLRGREAANRQIERTLDGDTRVAVFTVSGRTFQDFTSDNKLLHAAIDRIQRGQQPTAKEDECPPLSPYIADFIVNKATSLQPISMQSPILLLQGVAWQAALCLHVALPPSGPSAIDAERIEQRSWEAAHRVLDEGTYQTTLAMNTLQDLIRSMSTLPGTRTIVMVSPGFRVSDYDRLLENDVFDKAIRANVVVNTLDVRGLYTPPGFAASDSSAGGGLIPGPAGNALTQADIAETEKDDNLLEEFAAGTGGAFFHNNNDLEAGLEQLAARPEYVYVLGYSPEDLKYDGTYHKLTVKLKHGEHLEIQARLGYWAPKHKTDPAEQSREEIRDAIFSREELADIPMRLHTEFFKPDETKAQLKVRTWVDGAALKFSKASDRNLDTLTVVFAVFNLDGRLVSGIQRRFDFRLQEQLLESVQQSGLNVTEDFDLAPGAYVVRVVVRDAAGRSMAAHNQGAEIP